MRGAWAAGLAILALGAAAPAHAAPPAPDCRGVAVADPSGDTTNYLYGIEALAMPAPPSVDITGAFFRYDGFALTANISVADLSYDVPAGANGLGWGLDFQIAGRTVHLHASLARGSRSPDFFLTMADPSLPGMTTSQTLSGKFHLGPGGVVEWRLPEHMVVETGLLERPQAATSAHYGTPEGPNVPSASQYTLVDQTGAGQDAVIGLCPNALGIVLERRQVPAGRWVPVHLHAARPLTRLKITLLGERGIAAGGLLPRLPRGSSVLRLRGRSPIDPGRYGLEISTRRGGKTVTVMLPLTVT